MVRTLSLGPSSHLCDDNACACRDRASTRSVSASSGTGRDEVESDSGLILFILPSIYSWVPEDVLVHAANSSFPNYLRPLVQSESRCSSFHMQINVHSHENEFNLRFFFFFELIKDNKAKIFLVHHKFLFNGTL